MGTLSDCEECVNIPKVQTGLRYVGEWPTMSIARLLLLGAMVVADDELWLAQGDATVAHHRPSVKLSVPSVSASASRRHRLLPVLPDGANRRRSH